MHKVDPTAARLTGRCADCTADSCRQLAWATTVLTEAQMRAAARSFLNGNHAAPEPDPAD